MYSHDQHNKKWIKSDNFFNENNLKGTSHQKYGGLGSLSNVRQKLISQLVPFFRGKLPSDPISIGLL